MSTTSTARLIRAVVVAGTVAVLTATGVGAAQAGGGGGSGNGSGSGSASGSALWDRIADGRFDLPIPDGLRGTLLSAKPLTGTTVLPSAASNRLVTYLSEGARDQAIIVTGAVAVPRGTPPRGGWPVISYAHGTVGNADSCTPTRQPGSPGGSAQTLDKYVAAGYAVVQTDYEGLGTPGVHPYLNGESAARTVVDIVRAARFLDPRLGRDYVVLGHSQGGHSALWAAANRERRQDLRLLGAVSLSPGGFNLATTVSYFQALPYLPDAQAVSILAFLPTILAGAQAADPTIDAEALLLPGARPLLEVGRNGCISDSFAVAQQVFAAIGKVNPFAPGTEAIQARLTAYLDSQAGEHLAVRVPTMVVSSWGDTLVDPATQVTPFIPALCANSSPVVDYLLLGTPPRTGPGHGETQAAAYPQTRAFVDAVFAGRTPVTHQAC